jgi:PTH1 family peptidyl-tRNA hydrolase
MFTIVGLGNPGEEYAYTRHNAGREILMMLAKKHDFSDWKEEGKLKALKADGKLGKSKVQFILPDNFMNNSGKSVAPLIKSKKDLAQLVIIYDDIDLPIGNMKISFNKSAGGHRGMESIIKNLKSQEFLRIRIGIASATPSGKIKKPKGEKAVITYLMTPFREKEMAELKKLGKRIDEALVMIMTEGHPKAMSLYND